MGGFLSSLLGGGAAAEAAAEAGGPSTVISFHSTARWQLHFNASKETNKLGSEIGIMCFGLAFENWEKLVIDFSASWCGPCRMMEPFYNALSAKHTDVDFVKIDVDELSDIAQEFGVNAMPTFVLVKKGKEVERVVGGKKDELEKKVQKHCSL
ncbi:Thioredoxin [Parasponia andersonii]|uniref:Thioredoxin n=1 Tax=Parasponia andersonii TaxID=3476 RepID=A0A2P5CEL1_PARAD|nr:Thioredoxin [Parasponia andersonii]